MNEIPAESTIIDVPAPPRHRYNLQLVILGMAATLAAIAGLIAVIFFPASHTSSSRATPVSLRAGPSTVTYYVRGSAKQADVTYETPTGSSQQTGVDVPLKRSTASLDGLLFQFSPGSYVYLSAQNASDSGSVTCSIYVDGVPVSENSAYGAYAIATCKGRA